MSELLNKKLTRRELFKGVTGLAAGTLLFSNDRDVQVTSSAEQRLNNAGAEQEPFKIKSPEDYMLRLMNDAKEEESNTKSKVTWIDYAGAALFAKGVYELFGKKAAGLPEGRGHLGATEYAALAGLIYAKHAMGNAETKHHVEAEIKASLQAFGIIAASSIGAQGLKIDLETAYKESFDRSPKIEDKVALITMASSLISPLATTVSASAALTEEAQTLSRDVWKLKNGKEEAGEKDLDHPTVAALIDHVANASGFVLFGDPPFIAMVEKFGFSNAVKYQMETMWPMALLSLVSANQKINEQIISAESGMTGATLKIEALKKSFTAIKNNLPFMANIVGKSLSNTKRYMTGVEQNPQGFELSILEVLDQKLMNSLKFLTSGNEFKFPLHDDGIFSGVTQEHIPELEANEAFVGSSIDQLIGSGASDTIHNEVSDFLHHEDYDGLEQWLITHGGDSAITLVEVLRTIAHDKANDYISSSRSGVSKFLEASLPGLVGTFYRRINSHRLHNAVGPQLSDVINVFPFQAGSVIFLSPIFQEQFAKLRKSITGDEELSVRNSIIVDAASYLSIKGFSTVADNYVAAKLGLEMDPEKAHLVLAAAIRGGANLSPLSNMADPTLIPMHLYGLEDSWNQLRKGAGSVQHLSGFVWSEVIDKIMIPMGLIKIPKVETTQIQH